MKISKIRRSLTIISALLTISSILIIIGTFYTVDRFAVQSVTSKRTATPQGLTETLTFTLQNTGLYAVTIDLLGRIMSAQHEVVRNSTTWIIDPGMGGNYNFTMHVDNATQAIYFTPLAPQPVFAFNITGTTAYGLISVTFSGQRNINSNGG